MRQISLTGSTLRRRRTLQGFSSAQFSTVRSRTYLSASALPLTLSVPSILGIVIVLFFQCMGALFSSTYRAKTATKWSFVAYVSIMFSFVTIYTAMDLNLQSISYIDNREFPGNSDLPPGPLGYQFLIHANVLSIVPNFMFILCSWMANGLLVSSTSNPTVRMPNPPHQIYRCYELYNNNHLVIAFPCFALLASFCTYTCPWSVAAFLTNATNTATGIWFIHETARPGGTWTLLPSKIGTPYFSITAGLNVILTLLILSRLFLHGRNVRSAMGGQAKISSFFKAALAMIIESSALYAINSLLFVIPRGVGSYVANIFLPILAQTQVRAFLYTPHSLRLGTRLSDHGGG